MALLLKLPVSLSSLVLCSWLDTKELVKFDTSMCNRKQRGDTLLLFESDGFMHQPVVRADHRCQMKWFLLRSIKCVNLSLESQFENDVTIAYLRLFGTYVRSVIFSGSDTTSNTVTQYCQRLTCITYSHVLIGMELRELLWFNRDLTELHLKFITDCVTEVQTIFHGITFTKLQKLSVCCEPCVVDLSFLLIAGTHGTLLQLDLGGTGSTLSDAGLVQMALQCPLLRSLGLSGLDIGAAALVRVSELCPQIVHLDLEELYTVDDNCLCTIARNLNIRSIDITSCSEVTELGMRDALMHITQTVEILMIGAGDSIALPLPIISKALSYCTKLTTFHWTGWTNHPHELQHVRAFPLCIPQVTTLVLGSHLIGDDVLCAISLHCPCLHILDVRSHGGDLLYSEKGLFAVIRGCPQLRVLALHIQSGVGQLFARLAARLWAQDRPNLVLDSNIDLDYKLQMMPV